MKRNAAIATVLFASVLAGKAQAQDYRPFRLGLSYQLTESATVGDTTHVLRLVAASRQGPDSVFQFSRRTNRIGSRVQLCGQYMVRPDNLFGSTLTVRPGGEQVLTAANGHTFTLRPRAAIGQPWLAVAPNLTAQVTARTLGVVLGQPDSLTTISLVDGTSLVLSKMHGWVSGPALGHYLNLHLPQAQLTLTALPEARQGTAVTGALAVYDFQPGDVFLRKTYSYGFNYPCGQNVWTRDSIVTRYDSPQADTIKYDILRQTLTRTCNPSTSAVAYLLGARTLQTQLVTAGVQGRLTSFWGYNDLNPTAAMFSTQLHMPAWRTSSYSGRQLQAHLNGMPCSAGAVADTINLMDAASVDAGLYVWTAAGLGETRVYFPNFTTDDTNLLGYRKGSETWGQLTPFAQLLPATVAQPVLTTTAFPNPFDGELSVHFELNRPQPVSLKLRDALGRVVLAQEARPLASGLSRIQLATGSLPAGIYTALLKPAGGPVQALKVVKQ